MEMTISEENKKRIDQIKERAKKLRLNILERTDNKSTIRTKEPDREKAIKKCYHNCYSTF